MISSQILKHLRELHPEGDFGQLMTMIQDEHGQGAQGLDGLMTGGYSPATYSAPLKPMGLPQETTPTPGPTPSGNPAGMNPYNTLGRGLGSYFSDPGKQMGLSNTLDDKLVRDRGAAFADATKPVKSDKHVKRKEALVAGGIAALLSLAGARNAGSVLDKYLGTREGQATDDENEMRRQQQAAYQGKMLDIQGEQAKSDRLAKYAQLGLAQHEKMNDRQYAEQMYQRGLDEKRKDAQAGHQYDMELAGVRASTPTATQKDIEYYINNNGLSREEATNLVNAQKIAAQSRTKTEDQMRPGKVEGQNLKNEKTGIDIATAREKLKWLPREKQAAIDKLARSGSGVSISQQRLILGDELKQLGARRKELRALMTTPEGMAMNMDELAEIESKIQTIRDFQTALSSKVLPPKADAPTSGAVQYSMPVQGRVSSRFGPRSAPKAGASTMHGGEDIAVPTGTKIKAAADGRVIRVEPNVGKAGNIVVIQHADGSTTHYFHLSAFDVKLGDTVKRGQLIARSGASGNVTGPHLHFEIRDPMGNKIDPAKHVK